MPVAIRSEHRSPSRRNAGRLRPEYALSDKFGITGLPVQTFPAAKPKPADAPIDLGFVSACSEKLDTLDYTRLSAEQKAGLLLELSKLRGVAYQKMKLLK